MIVAIGASAGGLEACRRFLDAMPVSTGLAFVLVQHLDPSHKSLLVELLAPHTALTVLQAVDGIVVQAEHLYVIPPGAALAVRGGRLRLSAPAERHGARLPFDFLLQSLAAECGAGAMAVVLSGTGEDGSRGVLAIRARDGFVVVQDPSEAGFDGMPSAAITTGATDAVLPVAEIPEALLRRKRAPPENNELRLLVDLLRLGTAHDFSLYKSGTLLRRTERRMGLAGCATLADYMTRLRGDPAELQLLAKDLLIHVTGFFRDAAVFDLLESRIIPDLVASHEDGQPLRLWVPGCSTGEETWSLAMLCQDAIAASGRRIRLQIFASDVEPEAVATARQALYADASVSEIPAERRARYFDSEEGSWRIRPTLRATVVFAVQDVLVDPPFARLDMVSCRNLLIYLRPEAQARVIAVFHFALRPGGLLLLGAAEVISAADAGFEVVDKDARIWRRGQVDRRTPAAVVAAAGAPLRLVTRQGPPSRQSRLAELCRRLVLEHHAPAAVLVDTQDRCVHSLGPTERWLGHAAGVPSHDLFAMARPALRTRLRAGVQQVRESGEVVRVPAGRLPGLEIRPVTSEGEALLLVCFLDPVEPAGKAGSVGKGSAEQGTGRVAELERELEATRAELRAAIRNLEQSGEDQRASNEEALSVNEEFQSANEELLTSKEELQSLNEELTALNGQLQETLDRSRTVANDLQNVLYSTDVATLFLDPQLCIRFFTPAARAVFSVRPGDVGRPLADLRSLAADPTLLGDAAAVLAGAPPRTREVTTAGDSWFSRLVLPYRALSGGVEGVVLTYADITERRTSARALEEAMRVAEAANAAKSRFLAAVSHDLRQPLQTLTLLQSLLARRVENDEARRLVGLVKPTLAAMAAMLDSLLGIHQIDAGVLTPAPVAMPVGPLLARLAEEFDYLAHAQHLTLRAVPCSATIRSDPQLLEQILRNLLSNALKYTREGRVLLGCRRHRDGISIEVRDTGIGIADQDLLAVFEEFRQVDNPARERAKGLGLGLSIVQRLAGLLGHRLRVWSRPGQGSMFAIEVPFATSLTAPPEVEALPAQRRHGTILVVEDDPDLRQLLESLFLAEHHRVVAAADSESALAALARSGARPDVIVSDIGLPGGVDGLSLAVALRERLGAAVPTLMLTADSSPETLDRVARLGFAHLGKPARPSDVLAMVQRLLPQPTTEAATPSEPTTPGGAVIHLVGAEPPVRSGLRRVLEAAGWPTRAYTTAEDFLRSYVPGEEACLVLDANLPDMSGFDLLKRLRAQGDAIPVLMLTGFSDVQAAVAAMRAGATDFMEKPVRRAALLSAIAGAMEQARDAGKRIDRRQEAAARLALLTPRQRDVMDRVLVGEPSKNIAADLGISQRTVESHRAEVMHRTGARSLPALVRLVLAAAEEPAKDGG